jgi:tetratricopeptide (TPR) repeat protein
MGAGRLTEAEAAYRRLLDRDHDPSVDAPARLWLVRTLSAQGRMGDALRELQLLLRFLALEDQLRAAVQGSEGVARLELGDLEGAAAAAEQARRAAAEAGNHPVVSLATAALAMVEELRAHLGGALRIVEDGMLLADRSPQRQGHRYPLHFGLFPCFCGSRGRLHTCVSGLIASAGSRAREGVGWRVWVAMSGAGAGVGGRSSAAAGCGAAHQRMSWPRRSSRSRRGQRPGCCATTTTSSWTSCTMR